MPQNCTAGCPGSFWKDQEFTLFRRGKRFQTQRSQQSVITPGALLNYRFPSWAGGRDTYVCPGEGLGRHSTGSLVGEYKFPIPTSCLPKAPRASTPEERLGSVARETQAAQGGPSWPGFECSMAPRSPRLNQPTRCSRSSVRPQAWGGSASACGGAIHPPPHPPTPGFTPWRPGAPRPKGGNQSRANE